MNKNQTWACRGAAAFLFLASFLFFLLFFKGYLFYQEQFQLFLFTTSYFCDLVAMPGGIATWLARFFTQFYLYAVPGALICALFISGTQLLCSAVAREKNLLSTICSFIPALALWISMCQKYSLLVPAVSIVLSLSFVFLCRSFKSESGRGAAFIILTPVVYWICGPAALVFVLSSLSVRKWWPALASVALLAVFPILIRPVVSLNFPDLYFGRFLSKDPELSSWIALVAIGLAAVYCAVFSFRLGLVAVWSWAILAASFIASGIIISCTSDFRFNEEQMYSRYVRFGQWDKVIAMADRNSPMDKFSIACLNLALAMEGRLGDDMFKYVQADMTGLFPDYEKLHEDNLLLSDILYHIGFVSPSQRHAFECKESIPSMEKSSRIYQRLAQTNYINGQVAASQKYLDALKHTLFYRKWAEDFALNDPEMERLKSWRQTSVDYSFTFDNLFNEMGQSYFEHQDNTLVFQYAVAYTLILKDFDWFKKITSMRSFEKIPRHYQEAFLLIWVQTHNGDLTGLPKFISTKTVNRFQRFVEATNTISNTKYLFEKYGDTYWFYYTYNILGEGE